MMLNLYPEQKKLKIKLIIQSQHHIIKNADSTRHIILVTQLDEAMVYF